MSLPKLLPMEDSGWRARRPGTAAQRDAPLRRVDPDVARDIARWFLGAPAQGGARLAATAYQELQEQTDRQFAALTKPDGAYGYAVVWTKLPDPYSTEVELIEAVRTTGVLEITVARADRDRLHPALDCTAGGPYDRLRAVHDIVGHVMTGYGFDRDGEYSAWLRQSRLYYGLARWAAATELHAEHSVTWTTLQFPEHKAVLIPQRLLLRSSSRIGARKERRG
jgi:hypothetical protein